MNKLLIGIVAGFLVIGMATPVLAHDDHSHDEPVRDTVEGINSRLQETVQKAEDNTDSIKDRVKQVRSDVKERIQSHKQQVEEQRMALRNEIEASRTERKTELTQKRFELCETRQAKINNLIADSAKLSRERLSYIQTVEEKVQEFYKKKKLDSTEYDAAIALVNEKEATAIAAVEVAESQKFECAKVNGNNPSGELKTLHTAKRESLNAYRDSVKQLIQIVKAAFKEQASEGGAQ